MPRKKKESLPESQNPPVSDYEQALIDRISRARTVIDDVRTSASWKIALEDTEQSIRIADDNWHRTNDQKMLDELRITKLAGVFWRDIIKRYESDKAMAEKELEVVRNPDKEIHKDYDKD